MRGATGFSRFRWLMIVPVTALAVAVASVATPATSIDDLVAAVVHIKTFINPDGRSSRTSAASARAPASSSTRTAWSLPSAT